jgi:tripartite-type tricarboxylate transporter receptor subunit TctC
MIEAVPSFGTHPQMKRGVHRVLFVIGLGVATAQCSGIQRAGAADAPPDYPNRTVRIVVPFPAGGTADILPRIVAQKLRERWNQPVVVENKSGAGGNIGAASVATAAPDGYTLLASPPGPLAINESLYKPEALGFRPSDLEPVTVLGTVPNVLDVRPDFPAKNAKELIEYAKANPGKVSFASQGNGSTSHLTGILFQKLTNVQMVHIPYRGTAPALQDIMGSNVDLFFDNLGSSLALHQGEKLRILATGGQQRNPSLPDIPTLREAGVAAFESSTWFAIVAPPQTPSTIIQYLNQQITEVLMLPEVREQFAKIAVAPVGGSVAETASFFADEREKWRGVITSANVRVE